jgi:hypothetical protein
MDFPVHLHRRDAFVTVRNPFACYNNAAPTVRVPILHPGDVGM